MLVFMVHAMNCITMGAGTGGGGLHNEQAMDLA